MPTLCSLNIVDKAWLSGVRESIAQMLGNGMKPKDVVATLVEDDDTRTLGEQAIRDLVDEQKGKK